MYPLPHHIPGSPGVRLFYSEDEIQDAVSRLLSPDHELSHGVFCSCVLVLNDEWACVFEVRIYFDILEMGIKTNFADLPVGSKERYHPECNEGAPR